MATNPSSSNPLFSVIIPLEYHRGQWKRCWQAWNAQTVDKSTYEIILVVPPHFQRSIWLKELPADCLVFSDCSHDIGLCAAGAAKARGKHMVFTEAHCWPETDVLDLFLEAIDANPDWSGFSCQSVPITQNRLSKAEAEMYSADIEYAMQVHPWRKILDQCFVANREAYEACGGFKSELGHFAEWVLAGSYFQRGYKIGYFPKARFHHYYSGSLGDLKTFTLDFVAGEMKYFNARHGFTAGLFEIPPELICQGNFDRDGARAVLRIVVQRLWPPRHWPRSLAQIGRWIAPAIFGDRLVRISATAATVLAQAALRFAVAIGSQKWLNERYKKYVATLIRSQRLRIIGSQRRKKPRMEQPGYIGFGLNGLMLDGTGFYALEQSQGSQFRWSETAAAVLVAAPADMRMIRIDCMPVRDLSDARSDLRFYIDGVRIPSVQLSIEADRVSINLDLVRARIFTLGWTCLTLKAAGDPRQLGLAVKRMELIGRYPEPAATIVDDIRQFRPANLG